MSSKIGSGTRRSGFVSNKNKNKRRRVSGGGGDVGVDTVELNSSAGSCSSLLLLDDQGSSIVDEVITMESLQNKILDLESTLATFQIEVQGRFRLLEKLFMKDQAKSKKLKKLLEIDDSFTTDLMKHWNDIDSQKESTDFHVPDFNLSEPEEENHNDNSRTCNNIILDPEQIILPSATATPKRKSTPKNRKIYTSSPTKIKSEYPIEPCSVPSDEEESYAEFGDHDGGDSDFIGETNDESAQSLGLRSNSKTRGNQSFVWDHFTRFKNEHTGVLTAKCIICERLGYQKTIRTCNGTTSTLIRHLRVKHEIYEPEKPIGTPGQNLQSPNPPNSSRTYKLRSTVWKYYEKLSSETARCSECKEDKLFTIRSGTTSAMMRHLKIVHGITLNNGSRVKDEGEQDQENQQQLDQEQVLPVVDDPNISTEHVNQDDQDQRGITTENVVFEIVQE